jgi:hypothetical protein
MRPEVRIKKLVDLALKKLSNRLEEQGQELYVNRPVPSGYGKRNTLDFVVCLAGHFLAIETKAPDKWLTPLQRHTCRSMHRAGATVFIVSGVDGIEALERWIERNEPHFKETV